MRIVSIIEIIDNDVISIESFGVDSESDPTGSALYEAESLFETKAAENGFIEGDDMPLLESLIDEGVYKNGNYTLCMVWSDINNIQL